MKSSLRTVLGESDIAIIAVGMLLAQGVVWLFQLVWVPVNQALNILVEAVRYPYVHYSFNGILGLQPMYLFLGEAIPCFAVAWILSLWVYGAGPFATLIAYNARLSRKHGETAKANIGG